MVATVKSRTLGRPLGIPEDEWSEAVRREATVRSLAATGTNSRVFVKAAADALGLSTAQVYRLIGRFRENPMTGPLVVTRPGPKKGRPSAAVDVERRMSRPSTVSSRAEPRAANHGEAEARFYARIARRRV